MKLMAIASLWLALFCVAPSISPAAASETYSGSSGHAEPPHSNCNVNGPDLRVALADPCDFTQKFTDAMSKFDGHASERDCLTGVAMGIHVAAGNPIAISKTCEVDNYAHGQFGWTAKAADAGNCMQELGFKKHTSADSVPSPPKDGTVFIYEGGPSGAGHIEAYTAKIKKYCSDFCSDGRIDSRTAERKLTTWWEPNTDSCTRRNE